MTEKMMWDEQFTALCMLVLIVFCSGILVAILWGLITGWWG